jgi:hypothetical protein
MPHHTMPSGSTEASPTVGVGTLRHGTLDGPIDPLMAEADVLMRWPALSQTRLRVARHRGHIAWVKGKRGSAWYRPSAIETFITKELEQPCRADAHAPSLNLAANGSPATRDHPSSTVFGLSRELEEHAAQACARKI